jgi:mutator protein MutT
VSPTRVALALIHRDGRFFLQRRHPAAKHLPGLWEFPGGKLEGRESPAEALVRELREEIAWAPERLEPLAAIAHTYGDLRVELLPFLCEGVGCPRTGLAWGWFRPSELAALPMPGANRNLLPLLEERAWMNNHQIWTLNDPGGGIVDP